MENSTPKVSNVSREDQKPKSNEYVDATKAAFQRTWLNKYLWFWGIFIPMGSGIGFGYNSGFSGESEKETEPSMNELAETISTFTLEYLFWIIAMFALLFVISFVFWGISAIARSGVIQAVAQLQDPAKATQFSFWEVWRRGKKDVWRIILIDVIAMMAITIVLLFLALPVVSLVVGKNFIGAVFVGIIAIFVLVPISIVVNYVKNASVVIATLSSVSVRQSIELGSSLVSKNIKEGLKMLITTIVIQIIHGVAVFAVFVVFMIIGVAFVVLSVMAIGGVDLPNIAKDNIGGLVVLLLLSTVFLLAFLAIVVVFKSFFSVWQQDLWVWWIKRLGGVKESKEKEIEDQTEKVSSKAVANTNMSSK